MIDAFIEHHIVRTPMPRDLPPAEALTIHFAALVGEYAGWSGRIVAQIIAEGQADPAVLREFRERFHYGRRAVVREVLEQWRREGSIPAPSDIEVLADLIYAPIYMRLLARPFTARRRLRALPPRLRVPASRSAASRHRGPNWTPPVKAWQASVNSPNAPDHSVQMMANRPVVPTTRVVRRTPGAKPGVLGVLGRPPDRKR